MNMERMSTKMKKVLAICLMVLLVVSMSINAFAIPGGFVSSPSGNRAPVLVRFEPVDEDCTATLIITIYGDRHTIPEEKRKPFEDAYNEISGSDDLTDLCDDLDDLAATKGLDGKKLAVSDLFDLSSSGCEEHDGHKQYKLTLDVDTLDNFVGLIYRDDNGQWHVVKDAKVVNGELQFTAQGFHPYAIVVDTTEAKTGDSNIILICGAVMAVSAAALAFVLIKGKKKHA
jgi:hypothetical protein